MLLVCCWWPEAEAWCCAQDYNLRKRSENLFKRVVLDGKTISVMHPHTYAERFMSFFQGLFVAGQ